MIDLADLDRRAIRAMGLQVLDVLGQVFYAIPPTGGRGRELRSSINASDCREFEQWALAHGVIKVVTIVERGVAHASAYMAAYDRWGTAETNPAEHGPTYDLVARVLALVAALETEVDG